MKFRENLLEDIRDYASNTPRATGETVDCSMGVNRYGPHPAVTEVLKNFDYTQVLNYPHSEAMYDAITERWHGLAALGRENIFLCNGSFFGLFYLNNIFHDSDRKTLLSFAPTFTDMLTSAAMFGMEVRTVPAAGDGLRFDVERLISSIGPDTAMIYLDRPNNPTGSLLPLPELRRILDAAARWNCFVLVDEAYGDYLPAEESAVALFDACSNLMVTRTFSKGFGLAGLRAGYILVPSEIYRFLDKTLNPYILTDFVRMACAEALRHPEQPMLYTKDFQRMKAQIRSLTGAGLTMAETDDRVPILTLHRSGCEGLQKEFLDRGILTVSGREFEALDAGYVRVSLPVAGTPAEAALLRAIKELNKQ